MDKKLRNLFKLNGGILKASQLVSAGYSYRKIENFVASGTLARVKRGYYAYAGRGYVSESEVVAALFPDGVVSMESALSFYGYIDRDTYSWRISVPSSSSRRRFAIDWPFVKPSFLVPERYGLGITTERVDGAKMRIYDRERTICDCLRNRNRMDPEVFNQAIISYVRDPHKDVSRLASYARQLGVERKAREIIAIWL